MSSVDRPPEEYGDVQALMALGVALDRLGASSIRSLAEAVVMLRAFWAAASRLLLPGNNMIRCHDARQLIMAASDTESNNRG